MMIFNEHHYELLAKLRIATYRQANCNSYIRFLVNEWCMELGISNGFLEFNFVTTPLELVVELLARLPQASRLEVQSAYLYRKVARFPEKFGDIGQKFMRDTHTRLPAEIMVLPIEDLRKLKLVYVMKGYFSGEVQLEDAA